MANEPHLPAPSTALGTVPPSGLELRPQITIAGKYRLLRPAGFGGMGAVWVAENEMTSAEVAVKILLADDANSEAHARFRREAHAAATLSHRGIVRVFDLVELTAPHTGTLVMVMELLRGETLGARFDKQPRFEVEEALGIVVPLLSALAHAHEAGITHRDLKPENIFLSADPDGHVTPKILDFGISKLTVPGVPTITGSGELLGTPSYMSPEQARGWADVDARSDVFTMGILLYQMISGANPFAAASYHSVVAAILERDPEPLPNVGALMWEVIRRALSKRREERYADARALSEALCAQGVAPGQIRPSFPPRSSPSSLPPAREDTVVNSHGEEIRRRRRNVRVVLGIFGLIVAIGLGLLLLRLRAVDADRAEAQPSPRASATPMAVTPVPSERPPEVSLESLPQVPAVPSRAAGIEARKPASSAARKTQETPRAGAATVPAPKPSGVVRDPGF